MVINRLVFKSICTCYASWVNKKSLTNINKLEMTKISKGFTLVELLIVIAILAVLSTATVVVLNPAELLKQARDTQRVTDMNTMKTALDTYVATVSSPDLNGALDNANCPTAVGGAAGKGYTNVDPTTASFLHRVAGSNVANATRTVDGLGWLPVDFADIPGGSPMASLPVDPTNTGDYVYRYACNMTAVTYELNVPLESTKYAGYMTGDGGDNASFFEVGTQPGLNL